MPAPTRRPISSRPRPTRRANTSLAMSNTLSAAWPALSELFGGHQSARSVHFIIALLLVIVVLVHLFQVAVSGCVNLTRSMITGRFVVERERTR